MFATAENLDYQTVFQILATFEAFSVWKGTKAFKANQFTDINAESTVEFDSTAFSTRCDAVKVSKRKLKAIFGVILFLVQYLWRLTLSKTTKIFVATTWDTVRFIHRSLVFILKMTPIITIPAMSLSYLCQIGSTTKEFSLGSYVCYFIVAKTICYMICFILASILMWHIRVKPPTGDVGKIVAG